MYIIILITSVKSTGVSSKGNEYSQLISNFVLKAQYYIHRAQTRR